MKKASAGEKITVGVLILVAIGAFLTVGHVLYYRFVSQAKYETPIVLEPIKIQVPNEEPTVEYGKEPKPEVIVLNDDNCVSMDAVFSDKSVNAVMMQLQTLSYKLPKGAVVYLVMNTPGGSVDAGLKLINFINALPQKVKTITIFAASMGFHTVENLDERLIIQDGTLMSHPATFGVEGQTPYQVHSRLKWIMSILNSMDDRAADRLNLTREQYQDLVHDEYWVHGADAVRANAADRTVLARCGAFASPTKTIGIDTFLGTFHVKVSSCPLIPGYISIEMPSDRKNELDNTLYIDYVTTLLNSKSEFTERFIVNSKYLEFQK